MNTTLDSPMSTQAHHEYAGFWLRFVAAIIDGIVLSLAYGIIIAPILSLLGVNALQTLPNAEMNESEAREFIGTFWGSMIRVHIMSTVVYWLYFALMESSNHQATIGKIALGLSVTDTRGERIGFGQATGRYFAKYVSSITFLVGYIMAGFTEKKQALHDILASTLVVKK